MPLSKRKQIHRDQPENRIFLFIENQPFTNPSNMKVNSMQDNDKSITPQRSARKYMRKLHLMSTADSRVKNWNFQSKNGPIQRQQPLINMNLLSSQIDQNNFQALQARIDEMAMKKVQGNLKI